MLNTGQELWAIEIKLTSSPSPEDMARLDRAAEMIGADRRFLITKTKQPAGGDRRASCDWKGLMERV